MALNRFRVGPCGRVMQELGACSKSPQWHRANLVLRIGRTVLNDSIARADVVQQEVAERMKLHPPNGIRQNVGAAVNGGARWRSGQSLDVTARAADLFEDRLPLHCLGGDGASGRNLECPHECGERVDVLISCRWNGIVGLWDAGWLANQRSLSRIQSIRDAHFVHVGVASE